MTDAHRRLSDSIPEDIKDYLEVRLHSHTESSNGVLGDKIDRLIGIVEAHDAVLTSENMETLLAIIKEYQDNKIIEDNNLRMGKKVVEVSKAVVLVASVIAAIGYIASWATGHIRL